MFKPKSITDEIDRRKKISETMKKKGLRPPKDHKVWNKGLTRDKDSRVIAFWEGKKRPMMKYVMGWDRKGTKLSTKHKEILLKSIIGRHHTEEVKKIISVKYTGKGNPQYGKDPWNKGKKGVMPIPWNKGLTKKNNKKVFNMALKYKEIRKNMVFPKKDTSIEVKIQNFLTQLHIEYFTHKYINIEHGYQCDIFIPEQEGIKQKTIIECDGCFWHGCDICNKKLSSNQLEQIEKDRIRTQELEAKGFRVIRLWEHKIKNTELKDIVKIILDQYKIIRDNL